VRGQQPNGGHRHNRRKPPNRYVTFHDEEKQQFNIDNNSNTKPTHQVVTKWSSSDHNLVIKWLQFGHQVVTIWSSSGHNLVIEWSQVGHKVVTTGSPRVVTRQNKNHSFFALIECKTILASNVV